MIRFEQFVGQDLVESKINRLAHLMAYVDFPVDDFVDWYQESATSDDFPLLLEGFWDNVKKGAAVGGTAGLLGGGVTGGALGALGGAGAGALYGAGQGLWNKYQKWRDPQGYEKHQKDQLDKQSQQEFEDRKQNAIKALNSLKALSNGKVDPAFDTMLDTFFR